MTDKPNPFSRVTQHSTSNKKVSKTQEGPALWMQNQPTRKMNASNPGTVVLGSFEILQQLGVGSYATAYAALQRGTDRQAVVKIAHPHLIGGPNGEAIRRRFEVELRASTRVRHPNVITIYTSGELPDGTPAIAMEYIHGQNLEQWLELHAPIEDRDFFLIFHQLSSAIQAIHDAGIVHRDLSPRNVMLNPKGTNSLPHVTLLDFGISQLDGVTNMTAGPIGTPQFMAPEQLRGESTKASDIFSLGLLMWWAATGQSLFSHCRTQMEIFKLLANMKQAPDPLPYMPQRQSHIAMLIQRMLSPDPMKRPSADEIAAMLSRFTGMPGDSAEWFAVNHIKTDQYKVPGRAHILLFTHADIDPIAPLEGLPTDNCELSLAPLHEWEHHKTALTSHDLVLLPIPDDSVASRQILSHLASIAETLPSPPRLMAYRNGPALRGAWLTLGASDVICLPQDSNRLREHVLEIIELNSQKRAVNISISDTFNPETLSRSLDEDSNYAEELVETFIGHMPEWILELEEALDESNRTAVLKICGQLSAHAISVGAERVAQICRALCELPLHQYAITAPRWIEELESEYKKLFQELVVIRRR